MLISMKEHVEQQRVLVVVQGESEHLKELGVIDAEPRQGLRVGQIGGRIWNRKTGCHGNQVSFDDETGKKGSQRTVPCVSVK